MSEELGSHTNSYYFLANFYSDPIYFSIYFLFHAWNHFIDQPLELRHEILNGI